MHVYWIRHGVFIVFVVVLKFTKILRGVVLSKVDEGVKYYFGAFKMTQVAPGLWGS